MSMVVSNDGALNALRGIAIDDKSECDVVILTGVESSPEQPVLNRLNPNSALKKRFRRAASRVVARHNPSESVREYSHGYRPEAREIVWLPLVNVPALARSRQRIENSAELQAYPPTNDQHISADIAITVLKASAGTYQFCRGLTPQSRLTKSPKIVAVLQGASYTDLKEEVLLFDGEADAIVVDDYVLILNLDQFERRFGFLENLRQDAGRFFGVVFKDIPLAGGDQLLAACKSDLRMMSKLASIHENMTKYPTYAAALEVTRLIDFVRTRPHIKVRHQTNSNGQLELVFDPKDIKARWQILKLLADDYLHSELTSMEWEVNSKASPA
jgi:hypothetical protein